MFGNPVQKPKRLKEKLAKIFANNLGVFSLNFHYGSKIEKNT
jgi:hypothetical protein